jgi:hypothetical protein
MFFKKIKRGDAAVEWRWARDFEQTRVCVSEAPPPPRLLGARGARREKEAAAPPALVSVSPRERGFGAGGREGALAPRCLWPRGRRAPNRSLWQPGLVGRGERGRVRAGAAGRGDPRGLAPSRQHPGGLLSFGGASARLAPRSEERLRGC